MLQISSLRSVCAYEGKNTSIKKISSIFPLQKLVLKMLPDNYSRECSFNILVVILLKQSVHAL